MTKQITNTLEIRIGEIAKANCEDYPDIENCKALEQLYAIEQSILGLEGACSDLHKVISAMRERLGWTLGDYAKFLDKEMRNE